MRQLPGTAVGSPLLLQPLLLPKCCTQSIKQFLSTRAKTINLSINVFQ